MTSNIAIVDANGAVRVVNALDVGSGGNELLSQAVVGAAPATTQANITANGQTVVANMAGMGSVVFGVSGTFTGTIVFEACFDATQTTWFPLLVSQLDAVGTLTSIALSGTTTRAWSSAADGGMTFVRMRCSAFTSGSAACIISPGAMATEAAVSAGLTGAIPAGTGRIGFVAGAGIWFDTTSTLLAAGATFTGGSRDGAVVASGAAFSNAATYMSEFRILAEADVAGTLYYECSRDNANWRRIAAAPLAQSDPTCTWSAQIVHKANTRYHRAVFVNGASAQGQFMLQEVQMALV